MRPKRSTLHRYQLNRFDDSEPDMLFRPQKMGILIDVEQPPKKSPWIVYRARKCPCQSPNPSERRAYCASYGGYGDECSTKPYKIEYRLFTALEFGDDLYYEEEMRRIRRRGWRVEAEKAGEITYSKRF